MQIVDRGVVCVSNILCTEGPLKKTAIQKVRDAGGFEILGQAALKYQQNEAILSCALPALKALKP